VTIRHQRTTTAGLRRRPILDRQGAHGGQSAAAETERA
jgi:hypothetical protein